MSDTIVRAQDLTRVFGEGEAAVTALDGVTVEFPAGEFAAIMGPSGSGKSTLMHLLAGLDRPTSGTVEIEGTSLGELNDDALTRLRRDRVGFVFQSFNLIPVLDARENILLPLSIAGREARRGVGRQADRRPRPARPPQPPPGRAVRRPAAARRGRPRAGQPPGRDLRRRADRQPRLQGVGRDHGSCCAAASTSTARRSSWSPTTTTPATAPTGSSSCRDGQIVADRAKAPVGPAGGFIGPTS